jgi:hypothetical protein
MIQPKKALHDKKIIVENPLLYYKYEFLKYLRLLSRQLMAALITGIKVVRRPYHG